MQRLLCNPFLDKSLKYEDSFGACVLTLEKDAKDGWLLAEIPL